MGLQSRLHAGDIAEHLWGTTLTRFSPAAAVRGQTMINVLSGLLSGVAQWRSGPEFREQAAFLHELVHSYQDSLTGAGLWDYALYTTNLPHLLEAARDLSWIPYSSPPFVFARPEDLDPVFLPDTQVLANVQAQRLLVSAAEVSTARRSELREALNGTGIVRFAPGEEDPFLVESLLESEAAVTAFETMTRLASTEEQADVRDTYRHLYFPTSMSKTYSETFSYFMRYANHIYGVDESSPTVEVQRAFKLGLKLYPLFIDIASAHPSPDNVAAGSGLKFYPGVKLLHLVAAWMRLDEHAHHDLLKAFYDEDLVKFESVLLSKCELEYPPLLQVYAGWKQYLEQLQFPYQDDALLSFRKARCEIRLDPKKAYYCAVKDPFGFPVHGTPVLLQYNGVITTVGMNLFLLNREYVPLFRCVVTLQGQLRLVDYFLEAGDYRCPMAELQMCNVARPQCGAGIAHLSQFPQTAECEVFDSMDHWGFNLRYLLQREDS